MRLHHLSIHFVSCKDLACLPRRRVHPAVGALAANGRSSSSQFEFVMATALAAQLAQLAGTKPQDRYVRGKASLLYDFQRAADVSVEQLLDIARTGLASLIKADKRFTPFEDGLFNPATVHASRDQLTAEENDGLNTKLTAFLRVLTNHFLSSAAFQVLEYCIRRYKAHIYNVNELLLCGLPYHATPEFARLLAVLQLKGTAWEWLSPGQKTGAPPPRDVLVRRCANDRVVLRRICEGAHAVGVAGFISKTFLSFYAVLLCEVLAALPHVTEDLLTLLLPCLAAGLKRDASKEYISATLMVLTQLVIRARLSQEFVQVVFIDVARTWAELGVSTVVMMLVHLSITQTHVASIPLKALQVLATEHVDVAAELASLQGHNANLVPLLQLLLSSLVEVLPHSPELQPLMVSLLQQVRLNHQQVQAAAVRLLQAGAAVQGAVCADAQQQQQVLQQVLHAVDVNYPEDLDAAINTAFCEAARSSAETKKGRGVAKQVDAAATTAALFEFVQTCFIGSRHEVVAAGQGSNTQALQQQGLTLALAVHAPASELRIAALRKLDALCTAGDGSDTAGVAPATRQLLQSSLLSGLRDDVFAVAAAAAGAQGLAEVPADQQLPALEYLLQRAAVAVASGHVKDAGSALEATAADSSSVFGAKEALKAARAALSAVAALGQRCAEEGGHASELVQQQATAVLLEYALADRRCKKLAQAAVTVIAGCAWHPVLQAIAEAPAVAAAVEGVAADTGVMLDTVQSPDSKRRKKSNKPVPADGAEACVAGKHAKALALNRAMVSALAEAVSSTGCTAAPNSDDLLQHVGRLLTIGGPRCKHLLLLMLAHVAAAATSSEQQPAVSKPTRQARGGKAAGAGAEVAGLHHKAVLAAVLVKTLEQLLVEKPETAAGDHQSNCSASERVQQLPGDWSQQVTELLDEGHLPTKQHLQQLPLQLQHFNNVLLLAALHSALYAAPTGALTQAVGQPVQLLARLAKAAATSGGGAAAGLMQHVQLIVQKSGETLDDRLQLVSSIFGLPSDIAGEAVQAAALQVLPSIWQGSDGGSSSSSGNAWMVRLLAAANSGNAAVREAAVSAISAVATSSTGSSLSHLQVLLDYLQQHEQLLRGSPGALQQLLCRVTAGGDIDAAAGEVDTSSKPRRGSKAASSKGKASSQAKDAATGAAADSQEVAALVQQLLRDALPSLSAEGDLVAAQLGVAVLSAGADRVSAGEAAQQLVQQLLVRICEQRPVKHSAHMTAGAVWQQLVAERMSAGAVAAAAAAAAELQQLRSLTAASLMQFYVPDALQQMPGAATSFVELLQAPFSSAAAAALLGHGSSSSCLTATQLAAVAPVRVAAFQQLSPEVFAAMQPTQQQEAFTASLQTLAADGTAACRAAARSCLEQLPVTSDMLLVLLQQASAAAAASQVDAATVDAPPTPAKTKRARKSASGVQPQQQPSAVNPTAQASGGPTAAMALDAPIAALEFLQWRDDLPDRQQLMQPLQQLLLLLVPRMGSIAEAHHEADDDDADDAAAGGLEGPSIPAGPVLAADGDEEEYAGGAAAASSQQGSISSSAAGYAAQLVLQVMSHLVQDQLAGHALPGAAGSVDVELVLSCAAGAPDGAVRNAALLLLADLGRLWPQAVLEHALKALAVVQQSVTLQADAHSQAVASTTLSAIVPAWLAAGRGSEELWGNLIQALPGMPAHRRLGLLQSLLGALPEEQGLRAGLLLLMRRLAELSTASSNSAAPPNSSPDLKKGKKARAAVASVVSQEADTAAEEESSWLPELMAMLSDKVDTLPRLHAYAAVLESSLAGAEGALPAHDPLPRLAVSFVAVNLKAKSVATAISTARSAADQGDSDNQASLQDACQAIMARALQHLLQLKPVVPEAAADESSEGHSSGKKARKLQKAINAAVEGVYSLLSSLEAVQDCPSYLLALVQMSKQTSDSVQRRALKLLIDRIHKAQLDLAELQATAADDASSAGGSVAHRQLVEAGLAICVELPRLLSAASPSMTKQLALVAADAGIRLFGKEVHSVVVASMLEVLKVVDDSSAPVRASALTCIASGAGTLGVHLVPLLPKTAAAVLAAGEAAAQDLAVAQQQQHTQSDGETESEAEADRDEGTGSNERQVAAAAAEGSPAALQLAGAVAALQAMVASVGPFMSPYLPRLLSLLLHRQVLECSLAGTSRLAAQLRAALPVKVPARLLLQPLLQQWDGALCACADSPTDTAMSVQQGTHVRVDASPAVAFLDLVAAFNSSLQPSEAAAYHEQLAGLLLQALDTRNRWLVPSAAQQLSAPAVNADTAAAAAAAVAGFSSADVHRVEASAVRALTALVMKLSESRFKPLFLRLLDWTAAAAGKKGNDVQQGIGRVAALFAAVCSLGERLRGVFVPYYKYFTTLLMQQLAGNALSTGSNKRGKKKRKLSAADTEAGCAGSADGSVLTTWLAQLRAVRAVHLLALHGGSHDSPAAQQEQQERFDKLMQLLVEVLQEGPPAAVAAELAAQGADAALDLPNSPAAALGAVGVTVQEAGGTRALQQYCDIIGTAATNALVQIAVAGGSDVVWKPLHHALLLATRSGTTRAKLFALGGVSRLADLLREDYLNLLPEALGFIAELVEDSEVAVQAGAQGLLAQLEGLSGEKLEQYLKAS